MIATDITAPTMIAWTEPSPSSPAAAARRCAASGLYRSVRPSRIAGHAVDATIQVETKIHLHRNLLHRISDIPDHIPHVANCCSALAGFSLILATAILCKPTALAI
jgi:hypothetical protein